MLTTGGCTLLLLAAAGEAWLVTDRGWDLIQLSTLSHTKVRHLVEVVPAPSHNLDDGLALLGERQLGLHFPGDMFPLGGFRHPRRAVRRQQTAPVTSCCGMETAGFRRGRATAVLSSLFY